MLKAPALKIFLLVLPKMRVTYSRMRYLLAIPFSARLDIPVSLRPACGRLDEYLATFSAFNGTLMKSDGIAIEAATEERASKTTHHRPHTHKAPAAKEEFPAATKVTSSCRIHDNVRHLPPEHLPHGPSSSPNRNPKPQSCNSPPKP